MIHECPLEFLRYTLTVLHKIPSWTFITRQGFNWCSTGNLQSSGVNSTSKDSILQYCPIPIHPENHDDKGKPNKEDYVLFIIHYIIVVGGGLEEPPLEEPPEEGEPAEPEGLRVAPEATGEDEPFNVAISICCEPVTPT